jgi:hypothetical protein
MPFTKGHSYPGLFILAELEADRGSEPFYALHRGDQVVGFALNRWQNPKAPAEVLVDYGPRREACAEHFIQHQPIVPVFIREDQAQADWTCAGYFKLRKASGTPEDKKARLKPPAIASIYKILFLEEAQP